MIVFCGTIFVVGILWHEMARTVAMENMVCHLKTIRKQYKPLTMYSSHPVGPYWTHLAPCPRMGALLLPVGSRVWGGARGGGTMVRIFPSDPPLPSSLFFLLRALAFVFVVARPLSGPRYPWISRLIPLIANQTEIASEWHAAHGVSKGSAGGARQPTQTHKLIRRVRPARPPAFQR